LRPGVSCCVVLGRVGLGRVGLCRAVPCCAVLCRAVPCCAVPMSSGHFHLSASSDFGAVQVMMYPSNI